MAKNLSILFIIIAFPIVWGMSSCKKNQGVSTPAQNIIGTWKEAQYAFDDNNDGVIEASEIHNQPASLVQELTFNSDEAGILTEISDGVTETQSFLWTISANDSVWVAYASHDTLTYYLYTLNSSNLVLTTHSNSAVLQWYSYNKK